MSKSVNFMKYFIKLFFIVIFISFFTLYLSKNNGYFEYQQYKKTNFTKEQIEKFEQDVLDGKNVDITDYMVNDSNDYSNKISRLGLFLSKKIESLVKISMDKMVGYLDGAIS